MSSAGSAWPSKWPAASDPQLAQHLDNGKFRDECLSMEWFRNRIDAKITIEQSRRQYNEVRPHSSLGNLTPAEFKQ